MSKSPPRCASKQIFIASCLCIFSSLFTPALAGSSFESCLLQEIQVAADHISAGEIKSKCQKATQFTSKPQTTEPELSSKEKNKRFTLTSYKANYVLPVTYNWDQDGRTMDARGEELDNEEVKFQLSFKVPIYKDLPILNADVYFGYTQLSLWQAYNRDVSSPFRETNYEPEIFIAAENNFDVLGFTNIQNSLGFTHQSNGQGGELSRSWNRIYLQMLFERGNFKWAIKPWWRIPESDKDNPLDAEGDDNPDIERFMGNFEWTGLYQWNDHNISFMVRNNLRSENRGAIELGWSFPITDNIRLYMQYFNGYGESLINYDTNTNRLGIGFELTDAL